MIGQRFGKLIVIDKSRKRAKNGTINYVCKCDCGNISTIRGDHLRSGETLSCGCLIKKYGTSKYVKQGQSTLNKRLYKIYDKMKQRCNNKNDTNYRHYGRRGITVCDEWLNDFMTFYNWSMNNGYKENLTIDRINVNGNYEPNNCRWVDNVTQQNNKINTVHLTYNGKTQSIAQWSRETGIKQSTLYYRYHKGWDCYKCLYYKRGGK